VGGDIDGSRDDVAEIPGVPPGRYTLGRRRAAPANSEPGTRGRVQVYRSGGLVQLLAFLVLRVALALAAWALAGLRDEALVGERLRTRGQETLG
jgi:hypothetical protein